MADAIIMTPVCELAGQEIDARFGLHVVVHGLQLHGIAAFIKLNAAGRSAQVQQ